MLVGFQGGETALALSFAKGPDASASDIETITAPEGETKAAACITLDAEATLDLGGRTLNQPVINANGTLANGTLAVTDHINVTVGQNMTVANKATLDLTDAEIVVTDPANLTDDGWTFATSSSGGIVPAEPRKLDGALAGYTLFLTPTKARIDKQRFTVILK